MKYIAKSALVVMCAAISTFGPFSLAPAQAAWFEKESDSPALCKAVSDESEILWFARILYSETKDSNEMRLIAWVVRNRVETNYRGNTYQSVAQSKNQFSGLSPADPNYKINTTLDYDDTIPAWKNALSVAKEVFYAPDSERPFAQNVRHFYSPVSTSTSPSWAHKEDLALVVPSSTPSGAPRFEFYSDVK
jgi:hypothetical protein